MSIKIRGLAVYICIGRNFENLRRGIVNGMSAQK